MFNQEAYKMKKVYEITDIDSGLEYIKDVAPHLYDSTIESLQIIEEESNDISDRIFYNLHIAFSSICLIRSFEYPIKSPNCAKVFGQFASRP